MKSYGPTQDEDGIPLGAAADAVTYDRALLLWERRVGNGTLTCELLRANRSARPKVRLTANYTEGDESVQSVTFPTDELDEQLTIRRLEERMLLAQVRNAGVLDPAT